MVHTAHRQESAEQAVRRLAQKAGECGVRLVQDGRDGRFYASSVSHPGTWHYVTGVSCDCAGFVSHGRCMHHSALMVALGWVTDEEPDPTPAVAAGRCIECGGLGETQCTVSTGPGAWSYSWETCRSCHGQGTIVTAA